MTAVRRWLITSLWLPTTQAWGSRVQPRRCTSRLQLSTMSLLLLQPTESSGWVYTSALYLNSGHFFFFFTSRSGTRVCCHNFHVGSVASCHGWLDEGDYVYYVGVDPGGSTEQTLTCIVLDLNYGLFGVFTPILSVIKQHFLTGMSLVMLHESFHLAWKAFLESLNDM